MDERQHTPGPWRVLDRPECIHVVSADTMFQTGCISFSGNGMANAQRIAACVNACEGLADPQATITALVKALKGLKADVRGVLYEREALRPIVGNTNLAVLDHWVAQAEAALALVPPAGQGEK